MYDLTITWHTFQDHNYEEVLRASCIPIDAVIEILKMYQCNPSIHITINKIIVLNPTHEQCETLKELYKEDRDARLYNETDPKSVL